LSAKIVCTECDMVLAETQAKSYRELCFSLPPMFFACHAAAPHHHHTLDFFINGEKPKQEGKVMVIQCLYKSCRKAKTTMTTTVPIELVGLIAMIFHSAHEGHSVKVMWGDQEWVSPVPPHPVPKR